MNRPLAIVLFCLLAFSSQARGQESAPPLRLVQTIPLPNVKGRIGLRTCFMNLRTTEVDVDFILDRLQALARN